ncbi:MAG TPA: type II secretion system F family protein [Steroidobacteraceae bacterium]|nr:type II secretion system F family protein [Steroidobacteraceae bacterium]
MNAILTQLTTFLGRLQGTEIAFIGLAGAAAFAFSLGVTAFLTAISDPARRRLGQLRAAGGPARAGSAVAFADRVRPLAAYLLPSKEQERSRVSSLLTYAGFRSPHALAVLYGVKSLLILSLPCAVLLAAPFFPRITTGKLLFLALMAAVAGALLPSLWLDRRVKTRQRALRVGFPDALDLLVVCVEAGLGLAPAIQRVADELSVSHPELGAELALVNAEMRAGVERASALKRLAERTGLSDIRGLVTLMVQTMRFGTSVAEALRVYSEEFRDKRMQAAEEQAAKIGTKMIFPLVFCLFPSFFLVAIGPAVIRLVEAFSHMSVHH